VSEILDQTIAEVLKNMTTEELKHYKTVYKNVRELSHFQIAERFAVLNIVAERLADRIIT
jgi:hypothetical protein